MEMYSEQITHFEVNICFINLSKIFLTLDKYGAAAMTR